MAKNRFVVDRLIRIEEARYSAGNGFSIQNVKRCCFECHKRVGKLIEGSRASFILFYSKVCAKNCCSAFFLRSNLPIFTSLTLADI